jgi:hypothetical protein
MRASAKASVATAAAAVLLAVGLAGAWTMTRDSSTQVPGTEQETSTVSDPSNQPDGQPVDDQTEDDYDPALEEPTIEGDEPRTARELIEDSRPDSNTVDDGFLATDPEEESAPGGGWSSYNPGP